MLRFLSAFALLMATCMPVAAQVGSSPVQSDPVVATGGTVGRTVASRGGDALNIKDFGAKCDGVTDDTAAFAAAFALTAPTTIHIPTGTCRISGAPLSAASSVSLAGNGRGISVIQIAPGARLSSAVLYWGWVNNVTLRDLTIDLNGAVATTLVHGAVAITGGSGHDIENIEIKGAGSSLWLLTSFDAISKTVIHHNLLSLPTAAATQNQGINLSCYSGPPTAVRIVDNVLTNTGMDICAASSEISHNEISGWAFGGGITTEQNAASNKLTIIGNRIHDGATTIDSNSTPTHGIENWAAESLIADNLIWNNGGSGIEQGGQQSLIIGNVLWGNGQRTDRLGGNGVNSRNDNPTYNAQNSYLSDNVVFGNGNATAAGQGYGYTEQAAGLTGIGFGANAWAGPRGAANILGTPADTAFPTNLTSSGTVTAPTVIATGNKRIVVYGSADTSWPIIHSDAGMILRVYGQANGVQVMNAVSAKNITLVPNAGAGYLNPAVQGGDNLIYYTDGSGADTGSLVIAPWSNYATSPTIRMTPSLITLSNAIAFTPATPASSSAACTAGQLKVDANFIYVCTATNTWKRAALTTW